MSVGRFDSSGYSVVISDVGPHIAGRWPINLMVDAVGIITAKVTAFVDGTPGDGFAAELKVAYRVNGGTLSLGTVAHVLPIETFGSAAGITVDIGFSGEFATLIVNGLSGITFDVDTHWEGWSTA